MNGTILQPSLSFIVRFIVYTSELIFLRRAVNNMYSGWGKHRVLCFITATVFKHSIIKRVEYTFIGDFVFGRVSDVRYFKLSDFLKGLSVIFNAGYCAFRKIMEFLLSELRIVIVTSKTWKMGCQILYVMI